MTTMVVLENRTVLEVYKNTYTKEPLYSVINGSWDFYLKEGIMTFPKGDCRYGKKVAAELYENVNDYGNYNINIRKFIEEIL